MACPLIAVIVLLVALSGGSHGRKAVLGAIAIGVTLRALLECCRALAPREMLAKLLVRKPEPVPRRAVGSPFTGSQDQNPQVVRRLKLN